MVVQMDQNQLHLEKDRGNPRVSELNPYPYPFKTRTLVRGMGFQPLGVRVEQG
jgi:hypothetical protein